MIPMLPHSRRCFRKSRKQSGAAHSRKPCRWLSNTDVRCSPEALRRLRTEAERTGIAAMGPVIVGPEGRVEWDGGKIDFLRVKVIHERLGDAPREGGDYVIRAPVQPGANLLTLRARQPGGRVQVASLALEAR